MPGYDDTRKRGTSSRDAPHDAGSDLAEGTDERLLVQRSRRGDVDAFNELVARHQAGAYGVALRMLGDPDAAADVTQDAFLAAYRRLDTLRGISFRAWLLRIVSNGCYDYWRARGRRPTASLDALLAGEDGPADDHAPDAALARALVDPGGAPERVALRREAVEAIEAALLRLPDDQRLAVILSDVQGLPYEEVARVTDAPLGTVKSRIARGRARLREILLQQPELFGRDERRETRGR